MNNNYYQFIFLFLFISLITSAQNKKHTKCKLVFDKELGIETYEYPERLPEADEGAFDSIVVSEEFKIKNITKKYASNQRVQIVFMIDTNGKASLYKVLFPKKDKQINKEAKRIVELLPTYKPAICDGKIVRCYSKLNLPLYSKQNTEVK